MKKLELEKKLAETAATIRMLQEELSESNRGLLALNLEMDERVQQRTAELAQANEALRKEIVEHQRAKEELNNRNVMLQGISRIFESALTCLTEEELGVTCLNVAEELTKSKFGFIGEINTNGLQDIAISNPGWEACTIYDAEGRRNPPGNFKIHGIYGRVLLDGKALFTNDPSHHRDRVGLPEGHPPLECFLGVPLIKEGRTIGIVAVGNKAGGYTVVEQQALEALAPVIVEAFMRKRAEEALRESDERFRLLVEGAKDYALFMLDTEGRVASWNPGAMQLMGYASDEILGRSFSCFYAPEDLKQEAPERELFNAKERSQTSAEGWRVRKNGSLFWAETVITALYDGAGDLRGFAKLTRDTTERKQAADALSKAKDAAEQANRTKDHFLAVLSHELRTPLTPVVMGISVLQDKPDIDPDSHETLEMIRRNVEMESRLIDDLLDVTRISRGKIELNRGPIELCSVINRAVEVCRPDIESRKLHFGVDLGSAAPYWVDADVPRLQQVFWNLLKNSIKFTPHGGCVGIRCRKTDSHVFVEVNDSGIGIEPQSLSSIFNAFEQAEQSIARQFGGLGLGLAISKALVELHGGTISASSEGRGKGATFTIQLPLSTPASAESIRPKPESPRRSILPIRILLVEDHGVTAKMISQVLQAEGHEVEIAGAVADALELSRRKPFDLLLTDLGLPDGTGHDLLKECRLQGLSFPGIALSGYGQEEDIRQSHEAGFAAHLIKPASREKLIDVIASVLSAEIL